MGSSRDFTLPIWRESTFDIVAPDLPGHGDSTWQIETFEATAERLMQWFLEYDTPPFRLLPIRWEGGWPGIYY